MTDHPGGYRNPVIPGFHPDPSVCRVDDTYFLVTSSFTYFPGVPIFRSTDLVHWEQIGNVLDRPSQLDLDHTVGWASLGVYAPTIRYHDERFWMITTVTTSKGAHNSFVTTEDPAGPWSDPVPVDIAGIDPDLAWDRAGTCWVHFSGLGGIARCRVDDRTGRLLAQPERTWSGTGMQYPEAPHLFERDGTWYLLIAEGGTERGHAVSVARGPSPLGPWEPHPSNPILSHRSTDRPIQNTGHADFVEAVDGSWWLVALGVRPQGVTPRYHGLGRETFLAPVRWEDGWPFVDPLELEVHVRPPGPISTAPAPVRDDFDGTSLHPQWMALRRPSQTFASLDARPGWLTVTGRDATLDDPFPSYVGRRQQHHRCRVRTRVEASPGVEAGLAVFFDERSHYEVAVEGERVMARARIGPLSAVVGEVRRPAPSVVLVVEIVPEGIGGDIVALGVEDGQGRLSRLAGLDGRYLSTEVAGGFVGRTLGLYARGGVATFEWFDYEGSD